MAAAWDLTALVNAADARASQAERHLWLVRLLEWLRHAPAQGLLRGEGEQRTPLPVLRLKHLLRQIDQHPPLRERVRALSDAFWADIDAAALFADFGFGARLSFGSELLARLQAHVLPATPDTRDLASLFVLLFQPADAAWLDDLDASTCVQAAALLGPTAAQARAALLDAVQIGASLVQAAGHAPALRQRMDRALLADEPFGQLGPAAIALRNARQAGPEADVLRAAGYLRALLSSCRQAAESVMPHLEAHGVSVNIVFDLDQLQGRCQRIEALVNALLAQDRAAEGRRLLVDLVRQLQSQRSVRALFARHYSLLARQVAERHAESGEHYITRTPAEYSSMLRRAAGGGVVLAGTTLAKFAIVALGLSAFWGGFCSGVNYAASFLLVMLLHGTVATKQPAMTAPALAATMPAGRSSSEGELQAAVDRVVQLIRSQVAGVVGNLALCGPLVLAVQALSQVLWGAPLVGPKEAAYVLHSLTLLGPTALFAAFTGVLLFASSLVAGWAENWFVFHRLDSAIAWNPRLLSLLGAARARRWSAWWRANISGVAANVSLGFMLGLVPAVSGFVGLPVDVRHVTLATGQLAAALGTLGPSLLQDGAFWWCVAGIAATGVLNVTVSFYLAFKVALRSRGVRVQDRKRIRTAVWARLRQQPFSFLWPPRG